MSPTDSVFAGFCLALLGIMGWVMKRLVARVERGDPGVVETLKEMAGSLIEIRSSQVNDKESQRFLQEAFAGLTHQVGKLIQRMDRRHGLDEIHYRDTEDTHAMVSDIHRETVSRDTARRRLEDIEREHRERMDRKRESEP